MLTQRREIADRVEISCVEGETFETTDDLDAAHTIHVHELLGVHPRERLLVREQLVEQRGEGEDLRLVGATHRVRNDSARISEEEEEEKKIRL